VISIVGRFADRGSGSPGHAPLIVEGRVGREVNLFGGWLLAGELVRVELFGSRSGQGGVVEVGVVVVVVEVSHWDSMRGVWVVKNEVVVSVG